MFGFGYTGIIASMKKLPSGGSNGALTTAWIAATGETDVTILGALNTLESGLTTYGLTSKMKYLNLGVGATSLKHSLNFMNTAQYVGTFSSGFTQNSTGINANSAAYMQLVIKPSDLNQNSISYGVVQRFNTGLGFALSALGPSSRCELWPYAGGNDAYTSANDSTAEYFLNTAGSGFYIVSRTASNVIKAYKNGVVKTSKTTASISPSTFQFVLNARNNNGSISNYNTNEYYFIFVAEGLSDTDATNLTTIQQTFKTALSR
jgi:hypothetical protein